MYRNNKSGHTGVYFDNFFQKYKATINLNGKKILLGSFSTLNDAVDARNSVSHLKHDVIKAAIYTHNPNLDYDSTLLIYLYTAIEFYNNPSNKDKSFKGIFLQNVQNQSAPIPTAKDSISHYKSLWLHPQIMSDWCRGLSFQKLASLHNYSKAQIYRIILQNLSVLYRNKN